MIILYAYISSPVSLIFVQCAKIGETGDKANYYCVCIIIIGAMSGLVMEPVVPTPCNRSTTTSTPL